MDKSLEDVEGGFSAFKDSMGRFRTISLFWESRLPDYPAFFTIKKHPHEGCISLYEKYFEYSDPTEYSFAIGMLGSWDHWQQLSKNKWFKAHLDEWREELKIKLASQRYYEMKDRVLKDPSSPIGLQATKWLHDVYGEKPKRGAPSKAEVATKLKREAEKISDLDADAKRIGLVKSG